MRDPVRIGVYLAVVVVIVGLLALWSWPVAIVFALVFATMPLLAELTTRRRSR